MTQDEKRIERIYSFRGEGMRFFTMLNSLGLGEDKLEFQQGFVDETGREYMNIGLQDLPTETFVFVARMIIVDVAQQGGILSKAWEKFTRDNPKYCTLPTTDEIEEVKRELRKK